MKITTIHGEQMTHEEAQHLGLLAEEGTHDHDDIGAMDAWERWHENLEDLAEGRSEGAHS